MGKQPIIKFESINDVWKVIDILADEVHQNNESGKKFDVASSIAAQIPFFACYNVFIDKEIQKDIQRYIYCKEMNTPPFKGDFGSQPAIWIDRFFIIKKALAEYEKRIIDGSTKHSNSKI